MKRCSACGQEKALDEFRVAKGNRDGKRSQCKPCSRQMDARYKAAIPIERKREWNRRYVKRHPERKLEQLKRFRQQHPEKNRAHDKVKRALEGGHLVRPPVCEWCGSGGRIEASHGDYSKPLEVLWLCVRCHRKRDRHVA